MYLWKIYGGTDRNIHLPTRENCTYVPTYLLTYLPIRAAIVMRMLGRRAAFLLDRQVLGETWRALLFMMLCICFRSRAS